MDTTTSIDKRWFTVTDPVHGDIACVELGCGEDARRPVCLFLYGGGGSTDSLLALEPLLASAWCGGLLPPCRFITATVDPWGFYLDDAARGTAWETFIAERLPASLALESGTALALLGISMGGYGALKIALARPARFAAVAAIAPMIEPTLDANAARPRNRYHYPSTVPAALLGPARDAALYVADHPGQRAIQHADALRRGPLAIYLDAGTDDALHAHDGAEYLHRLLWQLDIRHEYHLLAGADHVGPSLLPRLQQAFAWLAQRLSPQRAALDSGELAWQRFLDGESREMPTCPLPAHSPLMPRLLRHMLAPLREAAATQDENFDRVFGPLPLL